ncbi:MAG TPA: amino acid synthesis family protein [Acidimicrobiia bacterium]|jgi:hypothetical protein|nr:amino acid synthesis family protein [Acidimicrobiia bacterium]HIL46670.1 amino acid synthesis family protein [Acidimicrobiia bacterium]
MSLFVVRKFVSAVEEIRHEFGPPPERPVKKAAMMAVVSNPYAGTFVEDFQTATEELKALGHEMGTNLIDLLGGDPAIIDGYGKGAIVGGAGEIEHGAVWHIPGGTGMRASLGAGTAIVPSTKKVAGMGARIDIPLTHLAWSYVGSHYDAMEVGVPDAPRENEIVFVLAMAIGGRVHERLVNGFTLADRGTEGVPA